MRFHGPFYLFTVYTMCDVFANRLFCIKCMFPYSVDDQANYKTTDGWV